MMNLLRRRALMIAAQQNTGFYSGGYFSKNGYNWTKINISSYTPAHTVYSDGTYLSGTFSGDIIRSKDGKNFALSNTYSGSTMYYGAKNPSTKTWIFVGSLGIIARSTDDGLTWNRVNTSSYDWREVCYSPELNMWVVVGDQTHRYAYSTDDGLTWNTTVMNNATGALRGICWVSELGLFVVVGTYRNILTSPDGIIWTLRLSSSNEVYYSFQSVKWSKKLALLVLAGGGGTIMSSTNGLSWTSRSSGVGASSYIMGLTWNSKINVFSGVVDTSQCIYSVDGTTWALNAITPSYNFREITSIQ